MKTTPKTPTAKLTPKATTTPSGQVQRAAQLMESYRRKEQRCRAVGGWTFAEPPPEEALMNRYPYTVTLRRKGSRKPMIFDLLATCPTRALDQALISCASRKIMPVKIIGVKKRPITSRHRRLNRERQLTHVGLLNMALSAAMLMTPGSATR